MQAWSCLRRRGDSPMLSGMPIPSMWQPMPWALERSPALRGVIAKLDRAEHHIGELEKAVDAFLGREPSRVLADYDAESAKSFRGAQEGRIADLQLSLLTGETLYHLRSSLDHIICGLIRRAGNKPSNQSQFPICDDEP